MTQKKAEILLASVIAARATSLLFSKIAMNGMGIFNLLAARFLMAFVLLAVVFFKRLRHIKRHTLVRGAIMGGLFFLMLSTELTGLKSTPSSTVSLLENTAIILVPMAEAVLRHKLPKAATAVSALVAIGGVALLTGQSGGFTPGMVLAVMAAVLYAAAIITTDRFSHEDDPLTLGIVQVGTLGLLALVSSFVFEAPHLPQSGTQWLMIAGLAVICTGFGFTLQPVAQSHTTAQRAGLFCALSPACATLLGAAVLREHISVMGMCGIALILLSLLVPQLWQLAEKKAEVEQLRESLVRMGDEVKSLTEEVAVRSAEVENLSGEKVELQNQLNTVYYIVGAEKELRDAQIINKQGFIGRTLTVGRNSNFDSFTMTDSRLLSEVPVGQKKATLVTSHPEGSYELVTDANKVVEKLIITDPVRFWESSKILIISCK